jgi:hypothetical protein
VDVGAVTAEEVAMVVVAVTVMVEVIGGKD